MGRGALDEYLYLMDEAFGGDDWHSLMTNVKDVGPDEWRWVAPGGVRPIGEMVSHVAGCKNMYQDHAFGPGTLTWADPRAAQNLSDSTSAGIEALRGRLLDAQRRLRASVDALGDDAELFRPRKTNWGALKETRWAHHGADRARPLSRRRDQPPAVAAPCGRSLGLRSRLS
jgi:hypothetical protein